MRFIEPVVDLEGAMGGELKIKTYLYISPQMYLKKLKLKYFLE